LYLSGIKEEGLNNFNDVIKVNFVQPIVLYETLKREILHFTYIVIGSQGDIHSSSITPSYNATKSGLSNYFESVIFSENQNHSVFFVKPWLFSSTMTNNSRIKSFLSSDIKKLSDAQSEALKKIKISFETKNTTLLHGVTSSGKTEIYVQLIE
jgi:short-subunit dehydrogenase